MRNLRGRSIFKVVIYEPFALASNQSFDQSISIFFFLSTNWETPCLQHYLAYTQLI